MSTDIDFDLAPAASPDPAAAQPARQTPAATSAPAARPAAEPETGHPVGELAAFLVTGGPAVAVIAGCWLLWAYGPWLLLGALLLAAVAAIAAIRALAARARRTRSGARGSAPTRAGPGGVRSLFGGSRRTTAPRTGSGSGGGSGAVRSGARPSGQAAGVAGAARRAARRMTAAGHGPAAGPGGTGGRTQAAASTRKKSTGRAANAHARAAKASAAPAPAAAAASARPTRQAPPGRAAARHGKPGLLRRTLAKTMPGASRRAPSTTGTGTSGSAGAKNPRRPPGRAGRTTPQTAGSTSRKGRGPSPARGGRPTPHGKTPTGRPKVRVTPAVPASGKRAALRGLMGKKKKANAGRRAPAIRGGGNAPRSKAGTRIARTARRAATRRKVRSARAQAIRSARRGLRAGSALLSPLAAAAFLRTGRALGWAQRHMNRMAASGSGPTWAPRLARGLALGLGSAMAAGLWVSRRRKVQGWLLRHYAAAGLGSPAVAKAVRAAAPRPARTSPAGHTAKPGPAIRITAPAIPTVTTPGATVTTMPEEIAETFEQFLSTFEPSSPIALTEHFESLGPMLERFAAATSAHAQRLGEEYQIEGGVVDMLEQFGAAFGGMHDLATEVVASWRGEHADDLTRHEEPRAKEQEFWNYQGE